MNSGEIKPLLHQQLVTRIQDLQTQASYGLNWYPEVETSMMHFIETDASILGKYNQECERTDGDYMETRIQEMGLNYDDVIT